MNMGQFFSAITGHFTGGSVWKKALFWRLSVTAFKDNDLSEVINIVTIWGECSTPGVTWKWYIKGEQTVFAEDQYVFITEPGTFVAQATDPVTHATGTAEITVYQIV